MCTAPGRRTHVSSFLASGPFPKKMLRRGAFSERHFDMSDPNTPFCLLEEDPVTKKPVKRIITNITAKRSFSQLLGGSEGERAKARRSGRGRNCHPPPLR